MTITSTDILADQATVQKIYATLGGALPSASPVNSFPPDPTQAPTPSPENSSILLFNGVVTGSPYLKDSNGGIWTLVNLGTVAAPLGAAKISGVSVQGGGAASGINQLLERQGLVYCLIATGQWQLWNSVMSSLYNATLPPAWTVTTPAGTPTMALPAPPTPAAVAPGSSGKIINCGSGQALATLSAGLAAAAAGDTVKLAPGSYPETPPPWTVPLLVDLGGGTLNGAGRTAGLARGKGMLVPCADSIIQNGSITGVAMDQTVGQLTSAIRPDAGCGYLTIKNMSMHGNQCAIGEGGVGNIQIEVDNCDISNNGLKVNTGSLTHNLYVGADCSKLTLNNVTSNGAVEGHAIKYRGPQLIVNGGTFGSAPGKPLDLPNGTSVPFTVTNATLVKSATDADHGILAYGEEGGVNGLTGGTITGGTITALCANPTITGAGGTISATGVTITGNKITNGGGATALSGF